MKDIVVERTPWEAVLFSFLVPGTGQMLVGQIPRGLIWLTAFICGSLLFLWLLLTPMIPTPLPAFGCFLILAALWVLMLIDAHRSTPRGRRSAKPAGAALLSAFFAGLGQFYNRRWWRGLGFIAAQIAIGASINSLRAYFNTQAAWTEALRLLALGAVQIGAILEAYRDGSERLEQPAPLYSPLALAAGGSLALMLIRTALWSSTVGVYAIASSGMEPTLLGKRIKPDGAVITGDRVIVDKLTYRLRAPLRGEIVTCNINVKSSRSAREPYIKRVAGLPQERIGIQPPYVYVDGQRLTAPSIFSAIARREGGYRFADGTLTDAAIRGSNDVVVVGRNRFFLLGDNTRNSLDSRHWGALDGRAIESRVVKIYWPLNRMGAALK
jgi:signal peptidase I